MKKNDKKIFIISIILVISFIYLASLCLLKYFSLNQKEYITYNESSNIDYNVFLKENDFFDNKYITKASNQYIASLIDYIDTSFEYNLLFKDYPTINYNYSYKIVADVNVTDKDNENSLYKYSEVLYESPTLNGAINTNINKKIKIDYNKYNDSIKSFVKSFDLDRAESSLKVSMYVTLSNNEYAKKIGNKVVSLTIPLTTKTVDIIFNSDNSESKDNQILIDKDKNSIYLLYLAIFLYVFTIIYVILYIIIYVKNLSPQTIYNRKLKSILNNYGSYIQEIDDSYKIGTSQVIKINTFEDLLEIRETLKLPLLMRQNDKKTGAFFMIIAPQSVIFAYALRVIDIIAKKEDIQAPSYDINDINKISNIEKKYSKEYIDMQISQTISMAALDADNAIRGNKDNEDSIYEQLEMTTSFNPELINKLANEENVAIKIEKEKVVEEEKDDSSNKKEKVIETEKKKEATRTRKKSTHKSITTNSNDSNNVKKKNYKTTVSENKDSNTKRTYKSNKSNEELKTKKKTGAKKTIEK